MAMPTSGELRISGCSQACGSIMKAVCSTYTVPQSLSTLSVTAGKTAPHAMTEFYGYAIKPVDFLCVTCTGNGLNGAVATGCLCSTPAMSAGEYYCANLCWYLSSDADFSTITCFTVLRSGVTFQSCSISPGISCSGCFTMCVCCGETTCIRTCARVSVGNTGVAGESWICFYSMAAGGCGNITRGTTRTLQSSYTCGLLP